MFNAPTVIVDFDGTLWDSDSFLRDLYGAAERYGIEPRVMLDTWERSWSHPETRSGYVVRRHAQHLSSHSGYDAEELYAWLEHRHACMGDHVYPDSLLFLHDMHAAGYVVVLLSHGDPTWQLRKLRATGLADLFDALYVTRHSKVDFLKDWIRKHDHEHMLFVNDNPQENWDIAKSHPRLAQAMRRNEGRWHEREYVRVGFPHFATLHEVGNYAQQYFTQAAHTAQQAQREEAFA